MMGVHEYTYPGISTRSEDALSSAIPDVSRGWGCTRRGSVRRWRPCRRPGSSSGGVQVVAGAVIAHRGVGISVLGGDLHVAQVHPGTQHGGEGVPEHVRMRPGDRPPGLLGEPPQAPGGGVPVHSGAAAVARG